ncbi:MAG: DUF2281 domain-containing protein [Deltaproteobacteria bacterium]|nr:DUF2281 domain-containing protein [Deltaproteobacteria bacterium]
MGQAELLKEISDLPPVAMQQLIDFTVFLKTRYTNYQKEKRSAYPDLLDEPFIGIWENRKDMDDSVTWVRKSRHTEWRTGNNDCT